MSANQEIGMRFALFCKSKDISYTSIFLQTGIAKSTITNFIKGRHDIKLSNLIKLIEATQIDPTWLILGRERKNSEEEEFRDVFESVKNIFKRPQT